MTKWGFGHVWFNRSNSLRQATFTNESLHYGGCNKRVTALWRYAVIGYPMMWLHDSDTGETQLISAFTQPKYVALRNAGTCSFDRFHSEHARCRSRPKAHCTVTMVWFVRQERICRRRIQSSWERSSRNHMAGGDCLQGCRRGGAFPSDRLAARTSTPPAFPSSHLLTATDRRDGVRRTSRGAAKKEE